MLNQEIPTLRTQFATTVKGLNRQSPAYRLFEKAKRFGIWNPSEIDFSQDKEDWKSLSEGEQEWILSQTSHFIAGEEAVTLDLLPLINVIAQEGRLEEEMFLTTFLFEEAKHVDFFDRFLAEVVGDVGDISHYHAPGYSEIFYQLLPEAMQALDTDHSPAAQVRASVTYNMVVEGVMAEVGYFNWFRALRGQGRNILPGMQRGLELIKMDESRHIAYGIFLLSRLIAADDSLWSVVEETFAELKPYVVGDEPDDYGEHPIFDLTPEPSHEMNVSLYEKRINRLRRVRGESLESIYKMASISAEEEHPVMA